MTIHPPAGHPSSDPGQLSDNLSFDFSPPKPGGTLGADPGLWLADDGASGGGLLGSDANAPNSNDQGAKLRYLDSQQNPSGITLPTTTTSDSTSSPTPPPVALTEDYGSGLLGSGPPGLQFLGDTKPSGGGQGGGKGGGGGSTGGGTVPSTGQYSNSYGLTFDINYDNSVTSASSGLQIENAFSNAVQYFLDNFASAGGSAAPLTITLDVGWGEVLGNHLSPFALGESETYLQPVSYKDLYAALSTEANATTNADQLTAVGPGGSYTNPISGANYWLATANAKALGLANGTSLDGGVGFSSKASWDFSATTAPSPGQYDFIPVAEHEISETMGRIALLGGTVGGVPNSFSNLDLLRYSASGQQSLIGSQTAYLSFDSGNNGYQGSTDPLNYFNTSSGGDYGDWQSSGTYSAGNNAYDAYASSGVAYSVSNIDGREMNVLGYALNPSVA